MTDPPPAAPSTPCFRFVDVSLLAPGGEVILSGVDATVAAGGITVLVGPSGSGKSSLLRLCNRLEAPTSGQVLFRGDDIAALDPLAHRRRVGMVFQRPTLFAGTVRDNLAVAAPHGTDAQFEAVLERVTLDGSFLGRTADDLSGGEAQRACIARALLTEPEVLLMDEATSALDPDARRAIERLALDLVASGLTLVWVTHDLEQVQRLLGEDVERVLVVLAGRVADPDEAAAFLADRDPE
ncbi:MAG TPA: phosphate ABC transporter ATP-binding protein [Acidimicrobiales bacterium]